MEIRFCSVCNESIPDGEFDAGRAVVTKKRSQHVACALRRSVEMSGVRSWLTFALAAFAAGVSVFLLVARLGEAKGPPEIVETPAVVRTFVASELGRTEDRLGALVDKRGAELREDLKQDYEKGLQKVLATAVRDAIDKQDERLRETAKQVHDRLTGLDARLDKLHQQMSQLLVWRKEIENEAERLREELDALGQRKAPPAPPTPEKPAEPAEPEKPAPDMEREREIDRWVKRLGDPDADIAFSATIELARLKALRATPELVNMLTKHKDYYCRLGAATALGEIRSADAVPDLIESLNDKDDLVRTAASESLRGITEKDFNFVSGLNKSDRIGIQKKWRKWWGENERAVRQRLNQTKQ